MFTWICPKCGREVPPAYSDCPNCRQLEAQKPDPLQAAPPPPVYQAPQVQTAPPPKASAQAAPLYVYDQQPVQQQQVPTAANPAQPVAQAQNPPATVAVQSPAPQLPYGAPQILQLAQAKVGDDTIIAYIRNSGYSYSLSADQIVYLKQQGVSDAVITAMLNQPKPAPVPYSSTAPAQQPVSTTTVAPSVTYVQSAPAASYYAYQPYYYPTYSAPSYSYPAYSWWPPISLSFGWIWGSGGGWHGGGGGWHGSSGGSWHGGGGGSWHGGGGGGHH